jgi:hypothetical protein
VANWIQQGPQLAWIGDQDPATLLLQISADPRDYGTLLPAPSTLRDSGNSTHPEKPGRCPHCLPPPPPSSTQNRCRRSPRSNPIVMSSLCFCCFIRR